MKKVQHERSVAGEERNTKKVHRNTERAQHEKSAPWKKYNMNKVQRQSKT